MLVAGAKILAVKLAGTFIDKVGMPYLPACLV
jgi:hypothetical protein